MTAETGGVLDRDQARPIVEEWALDKTLPEVDVLLDRLAGCVRPAAIDRDALMEAFRFMPEEYRTSATDWVLALVRPVADCDDAIDAAYQRGIEAGREAAQ